MQVDNSKTLVEKYFNFITPVFQMPSPSRVPNRKPQSGKKSVVNTVLKDSIEVQVLMKNALDTHRLGQLESAMELYKLVLEKDPKNYDAYNLSGVVAYQNNDLSLALKLIESAIAIQPNQAFAYVNRGLIFEKLRHYESALVSYEKAIALNPNFAEAHNNKGITLKKLNRLEDAIASYKQAISLKGDYAIAYSNLGNVLREMKRYEEAVSCFNQAIHLKPDYAEAYSNLGVTKCELECYQEALACHERAILLVPDYAEAFTNRGITLEKLCKFEEALASHDKAIELRPHYADAFSNRGIVLTLMMRLKEAIASYERAIELDPNHSESFSNLGFALKESMQFDLALQAYDRSIDLRPEYDDAYWNKSLTLLLLGDFINAWSLYEWRWKRDEFAKFRRNFTKPVWLGSEDISNRTILLHAEQGLGDTIQFCRYAKLVKKRGAQVILEVPRSLINLLHGLDGVDHLIMAGDPLPDFDYHCPLLSLPLAFETNLDSIPQPTPYLCVEPIKLTVWRDRLGEKTKPRIGLVWSGNVDHKNDRNRSIALIELITNLSPDYEYVSLQKEVRENDRKALSESPIRHYEEYLLDFTDTAALCDLVDLVISVDTSVAHLAGSIGKKTWLLLPYVPDWRWLLNRSDSPWYVSMLLYRQNHDRQWSPVLKRLNKDLQQFFV